MTTKIEAGLQVQYLLKNTIATYIEPIKGKDHILDDMWDKFCTATVDDLLRYSRIMDPKLFVDEIIKRVIKYGIIIPEEIREYIIKLIKLLHEIFEEN